MEIIHKAIEYILLLSSIMMEYQMNSKNITLNDHQWVVVSATIKYVLKLVDPNSETAEELAEIRDKIINAKQK